MMKNNKKQTGKVNYIWVLAGGYLIYLAWQLIRGLMTGEEGSNPILGIGGALVFTAFGGWMLYREWKAYKFGMDNIDNPETWSDDSVALEAPEEDGGGGDK